MFQEKILRFTIHRFKRKRDSREIMDSREITNQKGNSRFKRNNS